MLASRLHLVAWIVFGTSCTGLIEADIPEGITKEQEAARMAWVVKAQPVLQANCAACHDGSRTDVSIGWFEGGPDINLQKEDLLTYEKMIVNLGAPQTSMLLTKGAHEGPPLTAVQATNLIDWMEKEYEAAPTDEGFTAKTTGLIMMPCSAGAPGSATCPFNEIPLDEVGGAGAKFQFTATALGGSLYLSSLKLIPGPSGINIVHPLFVSVPAVGDPKLDPIDRYATLTLNLAANAPAAMQQIGNGTASFVGFVLTDPLAIYAKGVGPAKP